MIDLMWLVLLLIEIIIIVVLWVILERVVTWAVRNTEYGVEISLVKKKERRGNQ